MSELQPKGLLTWTDLTADEVKPIAFMEYDAREASSRKFAKAAFSSNPTKAFVEAQKILADHETLAAMWLNQQAAIRGFQKDKGTPLANWLAEQFTATGVPVGDIATRANVEPAYLSKLRRGRVVASATTVGKIANVFADLRELSGDEREHFIAQAREFSTGRESGKAAPLNRPTQRPHRRPSR